MCFFRVAQFLYARSTTFIIYDINTTRARLVYYFSFVHAVKNVYKRNSRARRDATCRVILLLLLLYARHAKWCVFYSTFLIYAIHIYILLLQHSQVFTININLIDVIWRNIMPCDRQTCSWLAGTASTFNTRSRVKILFFL